MRALEALGMKRGFVIVERAVWGFKIVDWADWGFDVGVGMGCLDTIGYRYKAESAGADHLVVRYCIHLGELLCVQQWATNGIGGVGGYLASDLGM